MKPTFRILLLTTSIVVIVLLPFYHTKPVKTAKSLRVAIQEPAGEDLVLVAPSVAEVGELVRLDLRESKAVGIKWQVVPETPDFEIIDGGKRALFSSRGGGTYRFIIAGARGDIASLIHHEIIIAGGPVPTPGPGPTPTIPLDQKVATWSKTVKDYPNKKTHAAALAGVFRKMADTKDVKPEQILESTALANSAVLGVDLDKWVTFLDEMGKELDAMVAANTLTTREQYRDAWLSIATGLDKVSK